MKVFNLLWKPYRKSIESGPRIEGLDVLRGLAVIFMVMVHVQNLFGNMDVFSSVLGGTVDFFGGPPAAPVFMFLMGAFFILSKKKPLKVSLKRGLSLLGLGYLLNILRGAVPYYIATEFLAVPEQSFPAFFTYEFFIFNVDILIFAGLAYMVMALMAEYIHKPGWWLLIALGAAAVAPLLWGLGEQIPVLGRVVQPLWSADAELATFALFPWIWFPVMGMAAGVLMEVSAPKKLVVPALILGLCLAILGGLLILWNMDFFYHEYGQMGLGGILAISGFVLLWTLGILGLNRLISSRLKPGILGYLSRNLTTIYVIHWLLLGWSLLFLPTNSMGLMGTLMMDLTVLLLASGISMFFRRRPKKSLQRAA